MSTELFIKASEIAKVMGKSKSYGYKIVRELNKELAQKGYMVEEGQTTDNISMKDFMG